MSGTVAPARPPLATTPGTAPCLSLSTSHAAIAKTSSGAPSMSATMWRQRREEAR
jgi:hypothetical protein